MGVLPLQFLPGESANTLGLTGEQTITVRGLESVVDDLTQRIVDADADGRPFQLLVRLDTRREAEYYRHGGVLPYVLRSRRG
jgi:aconitate hydratase